MAFSDTADLAVRLSLDNQFSRGMTSAQKSLSNFEGSVKRVGKGAGQLSAGLARAGAVGIAAVGTGLTYATKKAIDFQDAFAGVRKTVEGTPAELAALDTELRKLSTRVPIGYEDLANIAQEAGALGVPTKEVAGFTEVVARLSAATVGLSTDAAAEAFGKLGNVLNLHGKDFERTGSALVALGNAGASSEGDIIEVAKRFGAAGAQAKLSTAQVLGFSSAIASMGVEPEAAGSSLSRLFNNITKYIGTGSKKINAFAKVSKLSVKDFHKLFAKDASGAVQLFLTNLSKLDRFTAAKVLKEAGINNVRDINAVLLLARGHAELKRQVDLSTDAYKKNTELAAVSAKRFDTLKARLTELKNSLVLAGVTIADGFTPALGRAVTKLQEFLGQDANQSALKSLGEDIGKAIDGIDWNEALKGAKTFLAVMKVAVDYALRIASALNALPTEVKAAGAGLIGLNKLSGGLVGSGIGNIVGGLAGALTKSLAASIPIFGRAFVQPVFVTNMGAGLGGGIGGAAGAAGGLSGIAKVALVSEAIGLAVLVNDVRQGISDASTAQATAISDQTTKYLAAQPSVEALQTSLAGIDQGIHDLEFNPLNVLVQGDALDQLRKMRANVAQALADARTPKNSSGGPDDRNRGKNSSGSPDDRNSGQKTAAAIKDMDSSIGKVREQARVTASNVKDLDSSVGRVREQAQRTAAAVKDGDSTISTRVSNVTAATRGVAPPIVSAIYAARPIINNNISISATSITKVNTVINRAGSPSASRQKDVGSGLGPGSP